MEATLEQARTFFMEGLARYQVGDFQGAEQRFAAALSLAPNRPSVLTNLGAARLKLGRVEEAVEDLDQALKQEPENVEALGHWGTAMAQLRQLPQALEAFDRALALQRDSAPLWLLRGTVLQELGQREEAAASFRQSLARGGDDALNRFYLAALGSGGAPPAPPRAYVQALFDGYAGDFERHLVDALHYRAPEILCGPLRGRAFAHALDLGCGTGLAGAQLLPLAQRVTGLDLSAGMLAQAQGRKVYDALVQADAVEYLHETADTFDLVLAADVFIYLGALAPVFRALAPRMPAGGVLALTLEEAQGHDLVLGANLRYAHSESSLRHQAAAQDFAVRAVERGPLREEQGKPVAGLYAWLEKLA